MTPRDLPVIDPTAACLDRAGPVHQSLAADSAVRGQPCELPVPVTAAPELSAVLRLDHDPAQVRRARRHTRQALRGWGLHAHSDLAELVVSELVTNALCHGSGPVVLRLSYEGGELCAEVHDEGPGRPVRRRVTSEDEAGRGLVLIDGLLGLYGGMRGVRDDDDGAGKTVYVIITVAADRAGRP